MYFIIGLIKTRRLYFVIMLVFLFTSCSNDLEIVLASRPVIFVYSIVNPNNEYQYVRINKSFVGAKSAYDMAQFYDSLYPANIYVDALLFKKGSLEKKISAQETYEIPKDSGIFYFKKNLLYKLAIPDLISYDSIRIQIHDSLSNNVVDGSTSISKPGKILRPYGTNKVMNFQGSDYYIRWLPGSSYYSCLGFSFHYREYTETDEFHKSFNFKLQETFGSDTIKDFNLSLDQLMYTISSHLKASDDIIVRWMDSIDITVQTCERFLFEYSKIQTYNPSESALIYFTNINKGSGIVSSTARTINSGLFLDRRGLDSLKYGKYTKPLHFSILQ